MANQGRPRGRVPFVDLTTLAQEWDAGPEIRDSLRSSGKLLADKAIASVGIAACCAASDVLIPLLTRMVMAEERPLPQIDALRESIQEVLVLNNRNEDAAAEDEILKAGWIIRKHLGFIKMKVRRKEPSKAPWTRGYACKPF